MSGTEAVFWFFAAVAIISAFLCITRRSPVASALWLVSTLFALAAIFVLLDAHFIAAIQVLVYAGAIMVLFLFVIMLLNLGRAGPTDMLGWAGRLVMFAVGALLVVELWVLVRIVPAEELQLPTGAMVQLTEQEGAVRVISEPLFRGFLVPFEITSILLLAAIVGAVVLAKRKL
ncbi:MAG: NADH-quinone oxidoreductase subunit J [Gemmatimonadales bacterium]|nr:NADH-quinone oxidoreductase subunit J [Gemmatimonadales bacterium]NIN11601.1 NADH-quinone oxidoreductase subunit J [Gemmatimonadales bacterium]NIN50207.1 NADH-quinone oxidoreductase subunit J [Gemmatimonadales bacterium]NIP07671.1 NADH-quinone oxidoreductase subunit J [Gemmatimonadales bacterium]NIR01823.1 NADH-quinone oxidoreductase subunit J [Gemmatimonadales bacterium]